MKLDARLPIGMMFMIYGFMLVVFGLVSDDAIYARSLGINMTLRWGAVLLGFGVVMLWIAARAGRQANRPPVPPPSP